jgi:signal transduction histidine kinase
VAVTIMRVSLHDSDLLMNATLQRAFIGLAVILAVIVLLLLNHFRFVQYAELFRQQRELARMKDDFISIATHELKAPMSVIKGYISMTLEEKLAPPVRDMLKIAFDQTDRLGRLVTDLLDVSRIEQGRTKYNLAPVDVPALITPLVDATFKAKAAEKSLALTYTPASGLPKVMADPDRVGEIFTNLIDNAIKYTPSGSVAIKHVTTPSSLVTTISDTGVGLSAEEIGQLFQRFYRARNADTQDIPGTGLGLWIIKQYAQAMGGNITVASKPHEGTTFTVTLPLVRL